MRAGAYTDMVVASSALRLLLTGPAEPSHVLGDTDVPLGLGGGQGGIPVNHLAVELAARGVEVTLVTGSPYVERTWRGGENPHVIVVPFRADPRRRLLDLYARERRELGKEMARLTADQIHAHWTYEFALAALDVSPLAIVTARDGPIEEFLLERRPGQLWRLAMAANVRRLVNRLSANSPYTVDRWRKEMLWRDAMPVVPNMIPSITPSHARETFPLVASIGHLSRAKNLPSLIRAWPKVVAESPDAQLHLVGYDLSPHSPEALRLVRETRNVVLRGPLSHPETIDLLKRSWVVAHPSRQETLGNVVLEAMRCGTPVVANARADAVRWVLNDNQGGMMVDADNPHEFASAIVGLLDNSDLRTALGELGRRNVEKRFSPEAVTDLWLSLYRQSLDNAWPGVSHAGAS